VRLDYGYDRLDRVVSVIKHSNNTVLQALTYDADGNLTVLATTHETHTYTYTYDTGGLLTADTRDGGAGTETVAYTYDPATNLTALTDPGGSTTYGYDAANRLTSLADPFGQTTTFGYDNADHRTTVTWPGAGTQTNGYDNSGRETSLTVKNTAGTVRLAATYSYTTTGGADSDQMQSKTDSTGTTAYTYDSLKRLTHAGTATYTYDTAGNMTTLAGSAFTINTADQLTHDGTRDRGYDGAGNLTSSTNPAETYGYNSTNQFISTTSTTGSYTGSYDTLDQTQPRQFSVTTGTTTNVDSFVNTALGITQDTSNGLPANFTRDPKGTLITEKARNGSRYNMITDYQGSVLGLISTAGNLAATYTDSPYGTTTATGTAAGVNPFHYLGAYQTGGTTGNQLFGYRWYNSTWGRYTSTDPTRQEANNYAYAQGDPINNSDPTGAYGVDDFFNDAGKIADVTGAGAGLGGVVGLGACIFGPVGCGAGLATGGGIGAAVGFVVGLSGVIYEHSKSLLCTGACAK
jgi:RHS repeat-associated protein